MVKKFINVDELMPRVSLEQVAACYGAPLPELHRAGQEIRTRCFLACGKSRETGDRVLAIQAESAVKAWHCHQYGCDKNGNLLSMMDLLKPGGAMGGRPRGERFKELAQDLQGIADGTVAATLPATIGMAAASVPAAILAAPMPVSSVEPEQNVPLKDSSNEKARGLTTLDAKFVVDSASMSPKAAAYLRRRPFLTPDVCKAWRLGYLPRDTGGEDKSGGTMRGRIVYAYLDENGDPLTWFGRDPEFEEKHRQWESAGKAEREPAKVHFVKGFHRGRELYGQHLIRMDGWRNAVTSLGSLPVVEGPNDVIGLAELGVPTLGLCSNMITQIQAERLAAVAKELCHGIVTLFLDCDAEGEAGMKQALGFLSQMTPVRVAWTSKMYGGAFQGRQPELLASEEWKRIEEFLKAL